MIDPENPTAWFEPLYNQADSSGKGVPWAHMKIHPHFERWLSNSELNGSDKKALVVGCGMGDDAIELEKLGFEVTAFDVSPKAIEFCKHRFPDSSVHFVVSDLFEEKSEWLGAFDFVLEIYTIQALPPQYEKEVIKKITSYLAKNGTLLVVALVAQQERHIDDGPPWALTPDHRETIVSNGLNFVEGEQIPRSGKDGFVYVSTFKK